MSKDTTAIIIVNFRTPWHLAKCLDSVFRHTENFHIYLVQNSPDQKSLSVAKKFTQHYPEHITVIHNDKNLGYVGGVNSAYAQAMGHERVCFLNSDIITTPNWLVELEKCLVDQDVSQVCPDTNTHYPDSKLWRVIRRLPLGLSKLYSWQLKFSPPRSPEVGRGFAEAKDFYLFPGGFCNLTRTKYFADLGYFLDPNIIHGYWDDFDLGYYLRQFGKTGSTNRSYVYHFLNVSLNQIKQDRVEVKEKLMQLNGLYVMDKWRERLQTDIAALDMEQKLYAVRSSYVMQTIMYYFGIVRTDDSFVEYIRQIPAREVGQKFLGS